MKLLILAMCVAAATAAWVNGDANKIKLVQDAWGKVRNSEVDILYAVFKENPDIQDKFSQFAGKNLDELKGTPPFQQHAKRIVGLISSVVDNSSKADGEGKNKAELDKMGQVHAGRGVTRAQLNGFKKSVFALLKADGATAGAFGEFFDYMYGDNIFNYIKA